MWDSTTEAMSLTTPVRTAPTPISAAQALAVWALAVLTLLLAFQSPAWAQRRSNAQAEQSQSLRGAGPGARGLPASGRYVAETGQGFILDLSGQRPLMRFERGGEVWALRPTPAPRGDTIYRNDAGDQILRVTPDGGMTLFTTRAPQGTPVSAAGPAPSLLPPTLTAIQLWNFIVRQSERASQALGQLVVVDVEIQPGSEAVAADALSTVVDALSRMARSPNLREQAVRVRRVIVTDTPGVPTTFSRGALRIGINPNAGYAGRPSSARIVRVVAEGGV